jgi:hypothetical protein
MNNINELVQFAASKAVKKPTKDKAFDTLLSLLKGADVSRQAQAGLIKFFIPPVPSRAKTALDWVKRHTGQKDVRHYLNYFYVSGNDIVSTNGHYLAYTPNVFDIDDGFYNPKTGLKEDIQARYPDYNRVIPKLDGNYVDLSHCVSKVCATKSTKLSKFIRVFELPDGTLYAVNTEYYDSIISHPSGLVSMVTKGTGEAIRLDFKDGSVGVLMPMRVTMDDLITE